MSKEETKARQLMALALGSPYAEEGRTAALAAVRIIHEQELLDRKTPEPVGLASPPSPDLARMEREVQRLRGEIAQLRSSRDEAPGPRQVEGSGLLALDAASKAREIATLRREVARLRAMPPIVVHVVRSGDSPQRIAQAYTGSPARVVELLGANPRKPRVLTRWGWTFQSLAIGERLRLPVGWG